MFDLFKNINVDWMGIRRPLIAVSVLMLLGGLTSAIVRQTVPGGTDAFNLGVDFQGGSVITVKFNGGVPSEDQVRSELSKVGLSESVIQRSLDKTDEILIKIPLIDSVSDVQSEVRKETKVAKQEEKAANTNTNASVNVNNGADAKTVASKAVNDQEVNQVNQGRLLVKKSLDAFGPEAPADQSLAQAKDAKYKIEGIDSVTPVAGVQLRNQAVIATLLGMVGILLFIAVRYDWTYAAGAVIAVFHDVLVTLAFFTIFQWEISLTVLAALLTLVGFSVNDSIVIFDRIRENLSLNRKGSLYELTNDSINQTMSRTIVTNGLVFLSVLALVLFGGEVLRGFSLALFVGGISGTYSTIAIASPIAIWWQGKLGESKMREVKTVDEKRLASASRGRVKRRPVSR
ncbi:MAG: protein translocase subunit SecF [Pyrinomonadaceae bacterium]